VALFAAARAEIPLVPVNYRLGHDQLHELLAAHPSSVVIVEDEVRELVGEAGRVRVTPSEWMEMTEPGRGGDPGRSRSTPTPSRCCSYTSGPPPRRRPRCCVTGTCRRT
jgi:acyl-CoA synthetase (AMP-forming)/AMP-acid ligase II